MFTLGTFPHVVIAMRELFDLAGMNGDCLGNVKLNSVASLTEDFAGQRKDERLQNKITGPA